MQIWTYMSVPEGHAYSVVVFDNDPLKAGVTQLR